MLSAAMQQTSRDKSRTRAAKMCGFALLILGVGIVLFSAVTKGLSTALTVSEAGGKLRHQQASGSVDRSPLEQDEYQVGRQPARLMFVGDSITEGFGVRHPTSKLIPPTGLCSYRFELIRQVVGLLKNRSSAKGSRGARDSFVTVGPFQGTAGSLLVPEKCDVEPLTASTASPAWTKHAAVWGGLVKEALASDGGPYKKRQSNYKRFAKYAPFPKIDARLLTSVSNRSTLQRWVELYAPDVVVMLLGTNDLSANISPANVLKSLAAAVSQILELDHRVPMSPGEGQRVERVTRGGGILGCKRIVILSALLDRDGKRKADVVAFNKALDLASTRSSAPMDVFRNECVHVVDGGKGFDSSKHTCDGIHPNEEGEKIVALNLAPALADAIG